MEKHYKCLKKLCFEVSTHNNKADGLNHKDWKTSRKKKEPHPYIKVTPNRYHTIRLGFLVLIKLIKKSLTGIPKDFSE